MEFLSAYKKVNGLCIIVNKQQIEKSDPLFDSWLSFIATIEKFFALVAWLSDLQFHFGEHHGLFPIRNCHSFPLVNNGPLTGGEPTKAIAAFFMTNIWFLDPQFICIPYSLSES